MAGSDPIILDPINKNAKVHRMDGLGTTDDWFGWFSPKACKNEVKIGSSEVHDQGSSNWVYLAYTVTTFMPKSEFCLFS